MKLNDVFVQERKKTNYENVFFFTDYYAIYFSPSHLIIIIVIASHYCIVSRNTFINILLEITVKVAYISLIAPHAHTTYNLNIHTIFPNYILYTI